MANQEDGTPGIKFTQIAWVVKDLQVTKNFLQNVMGLHFGEDMTIRAKEFAATHYGKPSNAESMVAMTFSDGTFIELIQPLSGNSIFQDYIDNNPAGGIQHVAYSVPVADLNNVISSFERQGFSVISTFDTPIAKIVFFDTRKEIGVFTEIMGITAAGEKAVQQMKVELA